jgi:hypothetical protein
MVVFECTKAWVIANGFQYNLLYALSKVFITYILSMIHTNDIYKSIPLTLPFLAYFISALTLLLQPVTSHTHIVVYLGHFALFIAYSVIALQYASDLIKLIDATKQKLQLNLIYFKHSLFADWKRVAYGIIAAHFIVSAFSPIVGFHFEWYYWFGLLGYIALIAKTMWGTLLLGVFFTISTYAKMKIHPYFIIAKCLLASYYLSLFIYLRTF